MGAGVGAHVMSHLFQEGCARLLMCLPLWESQGEQATMFVSLPSSLQYSEQLFTSTLCLVSIMSLRPCLGPKRPPYLTT